MLVLITLIYVVSAYDLFWRDKKTGAEYDWTDLQREQDDPYVITDDNYNYGRITFNIGYTLGDP